VLPPDAPAGARDHGHAALQSVHRLLLPCNS
jgi:hypothetical protein